MRKHIFRALLLYLTALVAPQSVGQEPAGPTSNLSAGRIERLLPYLELRLPPGLEPYPTIVMVAGCSGFHEERFSGSYDRDADLFVGLGYAVARVDYIRAHGLDNSCAGTQNPTGEVVPIDEISEYITTTVEHMASRRDIDSDRIYLIGWSLGGAGVLAAMTSPVLQSDYSVAGVVNYFPGCRGASPWSADVPMLLVLAELDNITPPEYCRELVSNSPRKDAVKMIEYSGAQHCFNAEDVPIVTEPRSEPTCAFNPEAYKAAWQDTVMFLEEH